MYKKIKKHIGDTCNMLTLTEYLVHIVYVDYKFRTGESGWGERRKENLTKALKRGI